MRNGDITAACPERGDDPLSPKTWTDLAQQGSYMPEFWTVDRAGNISPVNDSNSFTMFGP